VVAAHDPGYNSRMHLANFGIEILETMFFLGLAGSAIVALISFIEDARQLTGDD
jgi:hypothetical protein